MQAPGCVSCISIRFPLCANVGRSTGRSCPCLWMRIHWHLGSRSYIPAILSAASSNVRTMWLGCAVEVANSHVSPAQHMYRSISPLTGTPHPWRCQSSGTTSEMSSITHLNTIGDTLAPLPQPNGRGHGRCAPPLVPEGQGGLSNPARIGRRDRYRYSPFAQVPLLHVLFLHPPIDRFLLCAAPFPARVPDLAPHAV